MRVAIFDFDGTLYEKETFQLLMDHLKTHPTYHTKYGRFFRSILPRYLSYKLKIYPEKRMKERSMQIYIRALEQLSKDELQTYFAEIAQKMQAHFNPNVMAKLEEHVENRDHVMLVSGAFTPLLTVVSKNFHVDTIIGTDIPFNGQSMDTTKAIYHIQGERKNEKILETLREYEVDWDNSYAYGDSYSDLPVLKLVGHPVAVQPDDRLHTYAQQKGWEII